MDAAEQAWDQWAQTMENAMRERTPCSMGLLEGTVIRFLRAKDSGEFLELDPTARIVHPHSKGMEGGNTGGMLVRKDAIIWVADEGDCERTSLHR